MRKILVLIIGSAVVLAGLAMVLLPGPALLVIPGGFAILATEFEWAKRWARVALRFVKQATSKKNIMFFIRANSLSLTLFFLFVVFLGGQIIAGHRTDNAERALNGQARQTLSEYVFSGHSIEATFENWESEFLQMWALVLLTVHLRQMGAADSKAVHARARLKESTPRADSPWPVRRGGWIGRLYEQSLGLALLGLFALSFTLHAVGGKAEYNQELARHGLMPVSLPAYLATSRFWFESLQNWQSEFLAVGVLLLFSIFLRQRGSAESKPVNAPHSQTGKR